MTEDGIGDLQDALDLLNFGAVEVELFDDVVPFPLIVDRVRKAPLTPGGDLLDLAPVRLDQLADLLDLLLDLLVIKLRLDDVHEFVRRHTLPPSYGFAPTMASRRQRSRNAFVSLPKRAPTVGFKVGTGRRGTRTLDLLDVNQALNPAELPDRCGDFN